MKHFEVPLGYRSSLISAIKEKRKEDDKLKKDTQPTLLDLGNLKIYLARHFGFCYGVENAIEIAYRTIESNQGKRIFLLSEMIHNPQVNADLLQKGLAYKCSNIIPPVLLLKKYGIEVPKFQKKAIPLSFTASPSMKKQELPFHMLLRIALH